MKIDFNITTEETEIFQEYLAEIGFEGTVEEYVTQKLSDLNEDVLSDRKQKLVKDNYEFKPADLKSIHAATLLQKQARIDKEKAEAEEIEQKQAEADALQPTT